MMRYTHIGSPIGDLLLAADDDGLRVIEFPPHRWPRARPTGGIGEDWRSGENAALRATSTQLAQYFAGTRQAFDLPLAPLGTPFQCAVWWALAKIPYGATRSYAQIAMHLGKPSATRAVGAANGRNPLPIVLPCHRVIGADGNLTGFGGGLPAKQFLLELEGALPHGDLFARRARA